MAPIWVRRRREREFVVKTRRVDFWPSDWLEGTTELSYEEEGCYIDICCLIYARGGSVSRELVKARRKCRHHSRVDVMIDTLLRLKKLQTDGELITNHKCIEELTRAGLRIKQAENAASHRWKPNGLDHAAAFSPAMPVSNAITRARQPETINQQPIEQNQDGRGRETPAVSLLEEKFEKFWSQYPSRKPHPNPKKGAFEKFKSKVGGKNAADPDEIIQGVSLFAEQCGAAGTEPKFIPTAVVWLNRDGWKDAIEAGEVELDDEDSRWWRRKQAEDQQWRERMRKFLEDGSWDVEEWGTQPGAKTRRTCGCPPEIIEEFGIVPRFHDDGLDEPATPPEPEPSPPPKPDEPEFGF
jgi:uncharacterized protein YdaU (DUF1376 family)